MATYNVLMDKADHRVAENNRAIRRSVCRILSSGNPEHFTIKSIASDAGVGEATVRCRASSPRKLLAFFDAEIKNEFEMRRAIQKEELRIGDSAGDFFTQLQSRFFTTADISGQR